MIAGPMKGGTVSEAQQLANQVFLGTGKILLLLPIRESLENPWDNPVEAPRSLTGPTRI